MLVKGTDSEGKTYWLLDVPSTIEGHVSYRWTDDPMKATSYPKEIANKRRYEIAAMNRLKAPADCIIPELEREY